MKHIRTTNSIARIARISLLALPLLWAQPSAAQPAEVDADEHAAALAQQREGRPGSIAYGTALGASSPRSTSNTMNTSSACPATTATCPAAPASASKTTKRNPLGTKSTPMRAAQNAHAHSPSPSKKPAPPSHSSRSSKSGSTATSTRATSIRSKTTGHSSSTTSGCSISKRSAKRKRK